MRLETGPVEDQNCSRSSSFGGSEPFYASASRRQQPGSLQRSALGTARRSPAPTPPPGISTRARPESLGSHVHLPVQHFKIGNDQIASSQPSLRSTPVDHQH